MIVYQSDKTGFQADVETGTIDDIILANWFSGGSSGGGFGGGGTSGF